MIDSISHPHYSTVFNIYYLILCIYAIYLSTYTIHLSINILSDTVEYSPNTDNSSDRYRIIEFVTSLTL